MKDQSESDVEIKATSASLSGGSDGAIKATSDSPSGGWALLFKP